MAEQIRDRESRSAGMSPLWQRAWRLFARGAEREVRPSIAPSVEARSGIDRPSIDISGDDPLVAYMVENPGVAEIEKLDLDSPALRALRDAGVEIAIPLVSQGDLIGLINLGPRLSEQHYSAYDRWMFESLAVQAAPAFRIAQMVRQQQAELQARERLDQQLRLARVIQQTLLPQNVPDLAGWKISAFYRPAWEVGGDFYDFIYFPDGRLGLVVGDVTDKGIPSAIVMATTRSVLRAAAELTDSPSEILRRANDVLYDDIPANMFITCLFVVLDPVTGRVCYANAGHDLPFRASSRGVEELRATGMPLGMMPGMEYEETRTVLLPGDRVLLYSDGLAEAHNPAREMFGFPRIKDLMRDQPEDTSAIDYLLDRLHDFTGPTWVQEDDVTLVALEREIDAPADVAG